MRADYAAAASGYVVLGREAGIQTARFPPLRRQISADIAIVGGGITGATIAWRFARAGLRVALLDAAHVGRGSMAASTALLMQDPDADYAELADRYGDTRTSRIWQLSRSATRDVVRTIRQLNIRCHLAERDSVYYAPAADGAAQLEREHRHRRAAGFGGRWLDGRRLSMATGIHAAAAIRTRGNAQVDPYEACAGFMHAAACPTSARTAVTRNICLRSGTAATA